MSAFLRWVAGAPANTDLLPRILNVVIFTALFSAVFFLVLDGFQTFELFRFVYDLGMIVIFGILYAMARKGRHFQLVLHLTTAAALAFFVWNFFFDAGIQGPTLTAFLILNTFIAILHRKGSSLFYGLLGLAAMGICLGVQILRPDWITPYSTRERWFLDVGFSYVICTVMVFIVMRMFVRLLGEAVEQDKRIQATLGQTEKTAVLGGLLSTIAGRAQEHLDTLGANLEKSAFWWHEGVPRARHIIGQLSPGQTVAFWMVLDEGLRAPVEDSSVRKVRLDELAVRLEQQGFPDPLGLTQRMAQANLIEWNPRWQALMGSDVGREAFFFVIDALTVEGRNRASSAAHSGLAVLVRTVAEYSRLVTEDQGFCPTNLETGLELVLGLFAPVSSQLEVVRRIRPVPPVTARPGQLIQVWTSLVQSSLRSMRGRGSLTVSLEFRGSQVIAGIFASDAGEPETEELSSLESVRQILQAHQGTLDVRKTPGYCVLEVSLPAFFPG